MTLPTKTAKTDTLPIGELIRRARRNHDLTQHQLAALIGAKQQSVSNWENRTNKPEAKYLAPLANALEIPLDTIQQAIGTPGARLEEIGITLQQLPDGTGILIFDENGVPLTVQEEDLELAEVIARRARLSRSRDVGGTGGGIAIGNNRKGES